MTNINDLSDTEKNFLLEELLKKVQGSPSGETQKTNKKRKRRSKKHQSSQEANNEQQETVSETKFTQNKGAQRLSIVDRVKNNKLKFLDIESEGKEDIKIDKQLWGNNKPVNRKSKTATTTINCQICNKTFTDVPVSKISHVHGTNDKNYRCPTCLKRRPN